MTKVRLTRGHQSAPLVQQSRIKRDWMDATYNKHAYQCLPMTVANVSGWELVLDEDLVVLWEGGNTIVKVLSGGTQKDRQVAHPSMIGIISLSTGWAINTEEGYATWITGSPNYFLDGAVPLSATIPSSWWPDEVQMNWKITKVNEPVTFPAGMPYCFFTIYQEGLLESVEFEVENIWDKPELIESRVKYSDMKMKNNTENPWTWTKGIKTGVDADGIKIGPAFSGLPKLSDPSCS
jgi:hypothetical protein